MSDDLVGFLLERIAEDEAAGDPYLHLPHCASHRFPYPDSWKPGECNCGMAERWRAECKAKRRIVELHRNWPVLVETQPEFDFGVKDGTIEATTLRMSKHIAWMTEQEYRARFGSEPPTSPMIAALVAVYADHPDFNPAWL